MGIRIVEFYSESLKKLEESSHNKVISKKSEEKLSFPLLLMIVKVFGL
jgi:hypothetical protein